MVAGSLLSLSELAIADVLTGPIQLRQDWLHTDGKAHVRLRDSWDGAENVTKIAMLSWDVGSLAWVKFTGAAGGGAGGAATIADGADVTQGAKGDSVWDGAAASVTGQSYLRYIALKIEAVRAALTGTPAVSVSNFPATQPVSAVALPLPAGAATEATLALVKAKTDNLDVLLSTRTKPADQQHAIIDSSALPTGASTEATLALIKAKTDNLDVLLSTRTKPADLQQVDVADEDTRILGRAKLLNSGGATIDPATETTLGLVAKDATVAKDASVLLLDTDFKAAIGSAADRPAAYTELDRLYQLGLKLDKAATEATMQKLLAAIAKPPLPAPSRPTLLHRS